MTMTRYNEMPEDRVETATSYFWLDDDGIICILTKIDAVHNIEDAVENVEVARRMADDSCSPLLIDMSSIKFMSRNVRECYANCTGHSAIALISKSVLSSVIANFFIGFNKPKVPISIFPSHRAAKKWLMKHRAPLHKDGKLKEKY